MNQRDKDEQSPLTQTSQNSNFQQSNASPTPEGPKTPLPIHQRSSTSVEDHKLSMKMARIEGSSGLSTNLQPYLTKKKYIKMLLQKQQQQQQKSKPDDKAHQRSRSKKSAQNVNQNLTDNKSSNNVGVVRSVSPLSGITLANQSQILMNESTTSQPYLNQSQLYQNSTNISQNQYNQLPTINNSTQQQQISIVNQSQTKPPLPMSAVKEQKSQSYSLNNSQIIPNQSTHLQLQQQHQQHHHNPSSNNSKERQISTTKNQQPTALGQHKKSISQSSQNITGNSLIQKILDKKRNNGDNSQNQTIIHKQDDISFTTLNNYSLIQLPLKPKNSQGKLTTMKQEQKQYNSQSLSQIIPARKIIKTIKNKPSLHNQNQLSNLVSVSNELSNMLNYQPEGSKPQNQSMINLPQYNDSVNASSSISSPLQSKYQNKNNQLSVNTQQSSNQNKLMSRSLNHRSHSSQRANSKIQQQYPSTLNDFDVQSQNKTQILNENNDNYFYYDNDNEQQQQQLRTEEDLNDRDPNFSNYQKQTQSSIEKAKEKKQQQTQRIQEQQQNGSSQGKRRLSLFSKIKPINNNQSNSNNFEGQNPQTINQLRQHKNMQILNLSTLQNKKGSRQSQMSSILKANSEGQSPKNLKSNQRYQQQVDNESHLQENQSFQQPNNLNKTDFYSKPPISGNTSTRKLVKLIQKKKSSPIIYQEDQNLSNIQSSHYSNQNLRQQDKNQGQSLISNQSRHSRKNSDNFGSYQQLPRILSPLNQTIQPQNNFDQPKNLFFNSFHQNSANNIQKSKYDQNANQTQTYNNEYFQINDSFQNMNRDQMFDQRSVVEIELDQMINEYDHKVQKQYATFVESYENQSHLDRENMNQYVSQTSAKPNQQQQYDDIYHSNNQDEGQLLLNNQTQLEMMNELVNGEDDDDDMVPLFMKLDRQQEQQQQHTKNITIQALYQNKKTLTQTNEHTDQNNLHHHRSGDFTPSISTAEFQSSQNMGSHQQNSHQHYQAATGQNQRIFANNQQESLLPKLNKPMKKNGYQHQRVDTTVSLRVNDESFSAQGTFAARKFKHENADEEDKKSYLDESGSDFQRSHRSIHLENVESQMSKRHSVIQKVSDDEDHYTEEEKDLVFDDDLMSQSVFVGSASNKISRSNSPDIQLLNRTPNGISQTFKIKPQYLKSQTKNFSLNKKKFPNLIGTNNEYHESSQDAQSIKSHQNQSSGTGMFPQITQNSPSIIERIKRNNLNRRFSQGIGVTSTTQHQTINQLTQNIKIRPILDQQNVHISSFSNTSSPIRERQQ
eukprot:403348234